MVDLTGGESATGVWWVETQDAEYPKMRKTAPATVIRPQMSLVLRMRNPGVDTGLQPWGRQAHGAGFGAFLAGGTAPLRRFAVSCFRDPSTRSAADPRPTPPPSGRVGRPPAPLS